MPELPDVDVYCEALAKRVAGRPLENVRTLNPFVLRTAVPPLSATFGRRILDVRRLGKRIVLVLEGETFIVVHLMIAGRLRWLARGQRPPGRVTLALFDFPDGTLALTEAGTKRRASIHVVAGADALDEFDAGGLEVEHADATTFAARLRAENHTLKRALTDPHILSGIGNAYSDEILHRARLSPLALTQRLGQAETSQLYEATRATLLDWLDRQRREVGDGFPEKVTAFRDGMAVHGRFGHPCPVCGTAVQRVVYAENETNYC